MFFHANGHFLIFVVQIMLPRPCAKASPIDRIFFVIQDVVHNHCLTGILFADFLLGNFGNLRRAQFFCPVAVKVT